MKIGMGKTLDFFMLWLRLYFMTFLVPQICLLYIYFEKNIYKEAVIIFSREHIGKYQIVHYFSLKIQKLRKKNGSK